MINMGNDTAQRWQWGQDLAHRHPRLPNAQAHRAHSLLKKVNTALLLIVH